MSHIKAKAIIDCYVQPCLHRRSQTLRLGGPGPSPPLPFPLPLPPPSPPLRSRPSPPLPSLPPVPSLPLPLEVGSLKSS